MATLTGDGHGPLSPTGLPGVVGAAGPAVEHGERLVLRALPRDLGRARVRIAGTVPLVPARPWGRRRHRRRIVPYRRTLSSWRGISQPTPTGVRSSSPTHGIYFPGAPPFLGIVLACLGLTLASQRGRKLRMWAGRACRRRDTSTHPVSATSS